MSTKTNQIRYNVYLNDKSAGNTMAGMQKSARKLRADIRKLEIGSKEWLDKTKQLKRVQNDMRKVNAQMRTQKSLVSRLAEGYNKYFAMFVTAAAGLTGLIMGFRKLSDTVVEFEKNMTNVYTLLSKDQLDQYRTQLDETAIKIIKRGHEIESVTKSMFDAISAGVAPGDMNKFADIAERLSVGGVADLSVATDGLTSVMNAYHLSIDETNTAADAFFSAQKEGKTTVAELSSNIGKIAPIAANLDISYQQLLSSMSALTKNGIDTASATTYLKGAMTALIKPTSDATKLFEKEFGHGLGATAVKTRGFTNILGELNILMQKYPDEMSKAIPNVRGLTAVTALSGKGFEVYSEILKNVQNDVGDTSSLMAAYELQQKTTDMAIRKAHGSMVAMTLELRNDLAPVIRGVMHIVSDFSHLILKSAGYIKEHKEGFKFLGKAVLWITGIWLVWKATVWASNKYIKTSIFLQKLFTGEITRSSIKMSFLNAKMKLRNLLIGIFSKKITFAALKTKLITAAQWLWNAALDANPIGIIIIAISALVGAIVILEKKFHVFSNTWNAIKSVFTHVDMADKIHIENLKKRAEQEKKILEERRKNVLKMSAAYDEEMDKQLKYLSAEGATDKEMFQAKANYLARKLRILQAYGKAGNEEYKKTKEKYSQLVEDFQLQELTKKTEANKEKAKQDKEASDKAIAEANKLLEDLDKIQEQINLSKLSADDKELDKLDKKYTLLRKRAKGNAKALKQIETLYHLEKDALILKQEKATADKVLKFKKKHKLLSNDQLKAIELDNLKKQYDPKIMSEEDFQTAKQQIIDKYQKIKDDKNLSHDKAVEEARKLYGLVSFEEEKTTELQQLQEKLDAKLLTQEEYEKAKQDIEDYYAGESVKREIAASDKRRASYEKGINNQLAIVNAFGGAVNAMMDLEVEAAGDNEEEKKNIRKKYADVQMAVTMGQIIANTSLAAMKAYAELGPVAGPIAAILISAKGMLELGMAKMQRDKIKGLGAGGYVDVISDYNNKGYKAQFAGIPTGGLVKKPTVFMTSEIGPEYIIPSWLRSDPVVADFERVIEAKRVRGFADGGATDAIQQNQDYDELNKLLTLNSKFLSYLITNGVKGVWDWDTFKDGYNEMTSTESENVLS